MNMNLLRELSEAVINGDAKGAKETVEKLLEGNIDVFDIIDGGIAPGLRVVGEKFETREYFIADLLVSANVAKEVMILLEPHVARRGGSARDARIVIGTVEGDIHDIGKNIVAAMLRGAGFDVVDLGVDVKAQGFVEAAEREGAEIVAISALLTSTMVEMGEVVKALEEAGIRSDVKVLVGGAPLSEEFAKKIGADAYGRDALEAVEKAEALTRRWVKPP
ncbi:MAG: B12-binding domain-containing protein [Candidatus Geothermarchaeales archaeon]